MKPEYGRTDETCGIESLLRAAGFEKVDAYRHNAASIRVRVASASFIGLDNEARAQAVEMCLDRLPERTLGDVLVLLTLTPAELAGEFEDGRGPSKAKREAAARRLRNVEFEGEMPPADGEITNVARRRWARAALDAYMRAKDVESDGDYEGELTCLFSDLLHLRDVFDPADARPLGELFGHVAQFYAAEREEEDATRREERLDRAAE